MSKRPMTIASFCEQKMTQWMRMHIPHQFFCLIHYFTCIGVNAWPANPQNKQIDQQAQAVAAASVPLRSPAVTKNTTASMQAKMAAKMPFGRGSMTSAPLMSSHRSPARPAMMPLPATNSHFSAAVRFCRSAGAITTCRRWKGGNCGLKVNAEMK